jgi:hypothetical protein
VSSLILAIGASVGFIWMYLRLKRLTTMVLILYQGRSVKASPFKLPTFNFDLVNSPTVHTNTTTFTPEMIMAVTIVVLQAVLVFSLISLVILLYKRYHNHTTNLMMDLTNGCQSIMIKLAQLPVCASSLRIIYPTEISDIELKGCLVSTLKFPLLNLKVVNILNEQIIPIPATVRLLPHQARSVNTLMNKPFTAHLLIQHCGMYQYVNNLN